MQKTSRVRATQPTMQPTVPLPPASATPLVKKFLHIHFSALPTEAAYSKNSQQGSVSLFTYTVFVNGSKNAPLQPLYAGNNGAVIAVQVPSVLIAGAVPESEGKPIGSICFKVSGSKAALYLASASHDSSGMKDEVWHYLQAVIGSHLGREGVRQISYLPANMQAYESKLRKANITPMLLKTTREWMERHAKAVREFMRRKCESEVSTGIQLPEW